MVLARTALYRGMQSRVAQRWYQQDRSRVGHGSHARDIQND
jgi:hypothetical protein